MALKAFLELRCRKINTCYFRSQAGTFPGPGGKPNSEPHSPAPFQTPAVISRSLNLPLTIPIMPLYNSHPSGESLEWT